MKCRTTPIDGAFSKGLPVDIDYVRAAILWWLSVCLDKIDQCPFGCAVCE
ncbi:hypothetical protein [Bacillus cereus]|nr:hypothetical protein [Bacillus cereus]MBJ8025920.1 hypothetical protein [Bacillus cereus]MBJ8038214.1 hypothetical protein [Bacillus cereus]